MPFMEIVPVPLGVRTAGPCSSSRTRKRSGSLVEPTIGLVVDGWEANLTGHVARPESVVEVGTVIATDHHQGEFGRKGRCRG